MAHLARPSLSEQAYVEIRRAIANGSLAAGDRVTERGMATELNVSPTPIREALKRLEAEGLIERTGPRTLVVAARTPASFSQRIELRAAIRGVVARFAARNATPAQLNEMLALLDESDDVWRLIASRRAEGLSVDAQIDRVGDLTARFNSSVAAAANNPPLIRLLQQTEVVDPQELRLRTKERMTSQDTPGNSRWRDDRDVYEAICRGDEIEAESIMIRHVRSALDDVLGADESA